MKAAWMRHIRIVLIFCALPLLLYCSQHRPEAHNGGQDTGGGSALASSKDQVNSALDEALRLISEPDRQKNIIVQFWLEKGRSSDKLFIAHPVSIFPKLTTGYSQGLDAVKSSELFESPELMALTRNSLRRLTSGDCLNSKDQPHKDASVSAHNLGADVCFSIGNLQRVSPANLLREMLSLALHEATHMGGAEEPEAVAWQQEFYDYFGVRFGDVTSDNVSDPTLRFFTESRSIIAEAQAAALKNPNDRGISARMGALAERLANLPYILDPLAIELKLHAQNAALTNNYSNSVIAFIEKLKKDFSMKFSLVAKTYPDTPPPPESPMSEKIAGASQMLDIVSSNFLALTSDKIHSTCILPVGNIELGASIIDEPGTPEPSFFIRPKRTCP
jgi:hypothetical protein